MCILEAAMPDASYAPVHFAPRRGTGWQPCLTQAVLQAIILDLPLR